MTIRFNLSSNRAGEAGPSTFSQSSSRPSDDLEDVIQALMSAKNLVIISGAGVSTAANIPDFRSSRGLFNDGYEEEDYTGQRCRGSVTGTGSGKGKSRSSGGTDVKDLFHVKCLTQHSTLAAHNALISSLASRALTADPTPFHHYLSSLSASGRLLRCYTQNIDDLESKVGLNVGIPPPKAKSKSPRKRNESSASGRQKQSEASFRCSRSSSINPAGEIGFQTDLLDPELLQPTSPTGLAIEPNVIPLHGLLSTLHCTLCHTLVPLASHLPLPPSAIPCPTCQLDRTIRSALHERPRKSGHLRPSVVLYGEEHPQGDLIGQVVERDLKSVDALMVAGTSLSVPGVKRIVKEMSKVIHSKPARKKGKKAGGSVVYVNDEAPGKSAEWKGIFDYFVQGDIQAFVIDHLENHERYQTTGSTSLSASAKTEPSTPKKKQNNSRKSNKTSKKDAVDSDTVFPPTPESIERPKRIRPSKKRKNENDLDYRHEHESDANIAGADDALVSPTKSRKVAKRVNKDDIGAGSRGVPLTPQSIERPSSRISLFGEDFVQEGLEEDDEEDESRDRQGTPTPLPFDM
ncbi:hypothetical protein I317_07156 [Kwoniella heveanensis CBS 569]|nr:hypothetical protein I317_07156 [Kwoniella heveanensis CBS 569]